MLEELKAEVAKANLDLVAEGLVIRTWGNGSGVDRAKGLVVRKPGGVPYDGNTSEQRLVSPDTGEVFAPASAQFACQRYSSPASFPPCPPSRKPSATSPRGSSIVSKARVGWTTPSYGNMRCSSRCRPNNDAA
jgi:hypothetical protein